MPRIELLPGVSPEACAPRVACDARTPIRRARRRAILQDVLQLTLLAGLDWLFLHWPAARVPLLGRTDSLALVGALNVMTIAWMWLVRALPRWTARRMATTWCSTERLRFFARERRQ
ncbi:MAG TPA: hypothetical protein VFN10_02085 [Thermoanaerobaculia bacterium]|nr:hypothetical protein [Thermoanaerobaculia bacterium]